MELTRRNLLGASAAAGAGLLLPQRLTEAANAATAAKPVPNVLTPFTAGTPTAVTAFLLGTSLLHPPNEQGWTDTIVAMPGEVTRILVPFGATIAGTTAPMAIGTSYMSDCHILEHKENDMMLLYKIVP